MKTPLCTYHQRILQAPDTKGLKHLPPAKGARADVGATHDMHFSYLYLKPDERKIDARMAERYLGYRAKPEHKNTQYLKAITPDNFELC